MRSNLRFPLYPWVSILVVIVQTEAERCRREAAVKQSMYRLLSHNQTIDETQLGHVCMYLCMYVWMDVCVFMRVYMYICVYEKLNNWG